MLFKDAQRHHGADDELLIRFLNGVQPQIAKIDGRMYGAVSQPQPQHTADNAVLFLLIQRIRLFQALCANIILDGYHVYISPV